MKIFPSLSAHRRSELCAQLPGSAYPIVITGLTRTEGESSLQSGHSHEGQCTQAWASITKESRRIFNDIEASHREPGQSLHGRLQNGHKYLPCVPAGPGLFATPPIKSISHSLNLASAPWLASTNSILANMIRAEASKVLEHWRLPTPTALYPQHLRKNEKLKLAC